MFPLVRKVFLIQRAFDSLLFFLLFAHQPTAVLLIACARESQSDVRRDRRQTDLARISPRRVRVSYVVPKLLLLARFSPCPKRMRPIQTNRALSPSAALLGVTPLVRLLAPSSLLDHSVSLVRGGERAKASELYLFLRPLSVEH